MFQLMTSTGEPLLRKRTKLHIHSLHYEASHNNNGARTGRTRPNHPRKKVEVLENWWWENIERDLEKGPRPTKEERKKLSERSRLTCQQVKSWFFNISRFERLQSMYKRYNREVPLSMMKHMKKEAPSQHEDENHHADQNELGLHPNNKGVQKCQHTGACNCEHKQQNSPYENPALEFVDLHMLTDTAVRESGMGIKAEQSESGVEVDKNRNMFNPLDTAQAHSHVGGNHRTCSEEAEQDGSVQNSIIDTAKEHRNPGSANSLENINSQAQTMIYENEIEVQAYETLCTDVL